MTQQPESDPAYVTANIPAFLIRSLVATLEALGFDASRIFAGLGLSVTDLDDPNCRISFRQGREIILRALRIAEGHALGLETGMREKIGSIGILGYAMLTAPTVGAAVRLGLDLQKESGSMLEFDTCTTADAVTVTASNRFHAPAVYVFLVEEAFANFMGIGIELVGEEFKPISVDFAYSAPVHEEVYTRLFRCPVNFGRTANAFRFNPALYDRPLAGSDPVIHRQFLDFIAFTRMRSTEAAEIIDSVGRIVRQNISGANNIRSVARALGMSERSLRRRLSRSDTSFQAILSDQRKNRTLELLANPQMSIEQIAHAVGYTDPHNFRRAFRTWTGTTPSALRAALTENWPK